jgi:hypothetical protein
MRSLFSGSFAGRIRTLVFWCPLSRSSSDGCIGLLLALPLLLLAVLNKEVESNVTAASDETLRLRMCKSRAKSQAT